MAAISGSVSISTPVMRRGIKATNGASSFNSVSFFSQRRNFHTLSLSVSCDAKKETVDKVCEIVRKQLAIPAETDICGESKFSDLGADSLDTVEIVMGLEERFDISVDEGSAQDIATVHDAAEMIEKLIESK